ncbi:MAG: hypothetical protein U0790_11125 [Isosphaeraceae bacterium]
MADDQPLAHAREPLLSRCADASAATAADWRPRRWPGGIGCAPRAYLIVQFERRDRFAELENLYRQAAVAIEPRGIQEPPKPSWRSRRSAGPAIAAAADSRAAFSWRVSGNSSKLTRRLDLFRTDPGLEVLQGNIQVKAGSRSFSGPRARRPTS